MFCQLLVEVRVSFYSKSEGDGVHQNNTYFKNFGAKKTQNKGFPVIQTFGRLFWAQNTDTGICRGSPLIKILLNDDMFCQEVL